MTLWLNTTTPLSRFLQSNTFQNFNKR